MSGIDFSKRYSDYARFLPAISEMYTRFVVAANPKRPCPVPQQDLDFLDPRAALYHLPCALYSAGQAAKSMGAAHRKDMVTGRNKLNTTILGDSGGFQIQQGSIRWDGDITRNRMMKWLEENCDWSMILDFPTGGIGMGTVGQHTKRLIKDGDRAPVPVFAVDHTVLRFEDMNLYEFLQANGQIGPEVQPEDVTKHNVQGVGFYTCMFQTIVNNEYFIKHRTPGDTRFLNVIQGRNNEESTRWYEAIKRYSDPTALDIKGVPHGDRAFEGWSLAGPHKENFEITLNRLLDMRRDGLIKGKNWMHILGVGKLANGCAYTSMQRMIREHDNPDFTISYDVSSPFTTAAFGNLFMGYTLDKSGWTIQSCKLDSREFLFDKGKLDENGNLLYEVVTSVDPVEDLADQLAEAQQEGKKPRKAKKPAKPAVVHPEPLRGGEPGKRSHEVFLEVLREEWDKKMSTDETLAKRSRFVDTQIGTTRTVNEKGKLTKNRMRMGDLCVNIDPRFTSTWDVVTYALLMNHNVQVHLEAVYESQELYDAHDMDRVPQDMLLLKDIINDALNPSTADAYAVVRANAKALNCLAGEAAEGGVIVTEGFEMPPVQDHYAKLEEARFFKKSGGRDAPAATGEKKKKQSIAQARTDGVNRIDATEGNDLFA